MIEIALVEDEDVYVRTFEKYIARYIEEKGVDIHFTVFRDGMEILDEYEYNFDIIFLDIIMKYLDGMTTAEKIRQSDKQVTLIFMTNSTQYAIRGYAVDAMDYVVKPVSYFSFCQKLDKAIARIKQNDNPFITLVYKNTIKKIQISDIYYVESQGHIQIFHTVSGSFEIRDKIESIEEKLAGQNFFRSNKGYLVNMNYVAGIEDSYCIINNQRLVISRNKKKAFMDELTKYLGDKII